MPLPLPPLADLTEAVVRLENMMKAYPRIDVWEYSEEAIDRQRAARGDALDAIDAWKASQGVPTLLESEEALSLERFSARVQRVETDAEIEDLVALLAGGNQYEGRAVASRMAPSLTDERLEAALQTHMTQPEVLSGFAKGRLSESQAERLVDFMFAVDGYPDYTKAVTLLLDRFPAILTPERARHMAVESLKQKFSGWFATLSSRLLAMNAFTTQELVQAAKTFDRDSLTGVIQHPLASPEVWLAVAAQPPRVKPTSVGPETLGYSRQVENFKALLEHPPAMHTPQVVEALVARPVVPGFAEKSRLLVRLLRVVTPESLPLVLRELLNVDAERGLLAMKNLPLDLRRTIDRNLLGEVAATHPDGQIRQQAILFETPLGEEVRPARRAR